MSRQLTIEKFVVVNILPEEPAVDILKEFEKPPKLLPSKVFAQGKMKPWETHIAEANTLFQQGFSLYQDGQAEKGEAVWTEMAILAQTLREAARGNICGPLSSCGGDSESYPDWVEGRVE